ncbi:MAG TPA: tail fiber domain-containing protein [Rhizomicrobium sp.]|jgi:hypothetical protein
MQAEAEIRDDPTLRADRFVARWQDLERQRMEFHRSGHWQAERSIKASMGAMGKGLERDAQMESILQSRARELGIPMDMGRGVGPNIADYLALGRERFEPVNEDNMAERSEISETNRAADPAAQAFEALRQEVALLRRAMTGLAADQSSIEVPDYGETLATISRMVSSTGKRLVALSEMPAFSYTLTNGTTADASQVMADFNCAALTGGTLTGATLIALGNTAATVASNGYGTMAIAADVAAGGVNGPGLYSYGSALGFGVAGSINFVTGSGGNTLSATIASNGNLTVYGSGTTCVIGSGTGTTNCTSDERLKRDIKPISGRDALLKLSSLRGVTYYWADPPKAQEQQVGVIAQQVQQSYPQLVGSTETSFKAKKAKYLTELCWARFAIDICRQ